MVPESPNRRVLLKLSGEAFADPAVGYGIDPLTVHRVADEIAEAVATGVEVAIVVGGGNIFRGVSQAAKGMDAATADYMGMLATVINALALRDALENSGVITRVQSAITMQELAEPVHQVEGHQTPREGPGRDLRSRHRESFLHHRHNRRPPSDRDRRWSAAQGFHGRWHLRLGSSNQRGCQQDQRTHVYGVHCSRTPGDGHHRRYDV